MECQSDIEFVLIKLIGLTFVFLIIWLLERFNCTLRELEKSHILH